MAQKVNLLEIELGHRIDGDGWMLLPDYFYIADAGNDRVKKHRCSDMSFVAKVAGFDNVRDVCSDNTHIYTTEGGTTNQISKYLCTDLSFVAKFGSTGSGNDQFSSPFGICTDGTYLYIVDYGNHRIKKHLCSDLSYVAKIGSVGSGDDQFNYPKSICTDGIHIYITDRINGRIKKHKCSDLSFVLAFGSPGSGDDEFYQLEDIDTDGTYLYIINGGSGNKLKKHKCFDLTYVDSTTSEDIDFPRGVCTDNTNVFLYNSNNKDIHKRLCADLSFISRYGSSGSGDAQFFGAYYMGYSDEGSDPAYYISHVEGEPSKVEENGVVLTERGSLDLCKNNVGSWYWDTTNTRLYVHTTGSDDPVNYVILSYFWEYITDKQFAGSNEIVFNGHYYLPYLGGSIPNISQKVTSFLLGSSSMDFGGLTIINADGRYDSRLDKYIYEAKKAIFKQGELGDAYGSYVNFWRGWTGKVSLNDNEIEIDTEDLRGKY